MATLFLGQRQGAPPSVPPVAIKVIHETLSDDWQFVRMFIDEALISVRIRHPNVVRVEELGEKDDSYYLVMEYVHGVSLAQLLRTLGKQGRRMRPEIAVWIATQVAAGLHAAHEMTGEGGELLNVIHRDVSPQNVLISSDGHAKLLDFGIAKAAGRAERTEAGVIKGKVRYMAPEQAKGDDLDRRVDVYALAVVLWELLTMRRFIEGKSEIEIIRRVRNPEAVPPSERVPGIDPRIDEAVLAGLAVDRDQRPISALAFQQLLERAVPPGTVGPAHVAELLRVFLGDELAESVASIPAPIAAALGDTSNSARPLPGEDEHTAQRASREERTRVLTVEETTGTDKDLIATDDDDEDDVATQSRPAPVDVRKTVEAPAQFDLEALPEYGATDDEERTMEAGGVELQQFLDRMRADAKSARRPASPPAPTPAPALAPTPAPLPPAPARAAPPTEKLARPSTAATGPSAAGWVARVFAVTLVAFAIGAAFAFAWVRDESRRSVSRTPRGGRRRGSSPR